MSPGSGRWQAALLRAREVQRHNLLVRLAAESAHGRAGKVLVLVAADRVLAAARYPRRP
jgi:hypothetical protein